MTSEDKPERCVTALSPVETTVCGDTEGLRGTSAYTTASGGGVWGWGFGPRQIAFE